MSADAVRVRVWTGAVEGAIRRAALGVAAKEDAARALGQAIRTLRRRAEGAEERECNAARRRDELEAVVAGQSADLSRLVAELVEMTNRRDDALARVARLERERDDALMQASAAAERAYNAARALERERELRDAADADGGES